MYLHPLLISVLPEDRTELVQQSALRSYRRGDVVMDVDAAAECVYCVADGLLRVTVSGGGSGEDITSDFIKRDEFFLSSAFNEPEYRGGTSLVAALPSSVYVVPWEAMQRLCSKYPDVMMGLLKAGIKRTAMLRKQLRRISSSSSEPLISRVLHELTQLAPIDGGFDKRITQAVIASYSGLSREQVNKTMRDFESRGLVKKDGHAIHVPSEFASSDYREPQVVDKGDKAADESDPVDPSFFAQLFDDLARQAS